MFSYRWLEEDDYDSTLVPWWKSHRWTPPLQDFLPDNGKSGIMVSKGDIDICAGFLYLTNSNVCFMEFLISNFDYREEDRGDAIDFLLGVLGFVAKDSGMKYMYSTLKNKNLLDRYLKVGFIEGDKNATELIRVLA